VSEHLQAEHVPTNRLAVTKSVYILDKHRPISTFVQLSPRAAAEAAGLIDPEPPANTSDTPPVREVRENQLLPMDEFKRNIMLVPNSYYENDRFTAPSTSYSYPINNDTCAHVQTPTGVIQVPAQYSLPTVSANDCLRALFLCTV
jgi:hypothetical protein